MNAPIIPWEGIGQFKLNDHIKNYYDLIKDLNTKAQLIYKFDVRYTVIDNIYLWFSFLNGKMWKVTVFGDYQGKLFDKIGIGTHIDQVLEIDPSFEYDEFEEVYCSPNGIFIETHPIENTVQWISVYSKELDNPDFELGNW